MILTNIDELRRCFPTHAIDHIEPYVGYIDNAEHEVLMPALGQPLYDKLCEYYTDNGGSHSFVDEKTTGYYNKLLLMAQQLVAFDAMGRSLDFQAISINNAGLNFSTSDDYQKADRDAKNDAKSAANREVHAKLNQLLYTLEQWVKEAAAVSSSSSSSDSDADVLDGFSVELQEITTLWKQSRYYYLAAQMLIPSAKTMQEYIDIMDSREKFIRMLPDLRFIQEEQIAPAIGEDFCDWLVAYALRTEIPAGGDAGNHSPHSQGGAGGGYSRLFDRIVHKLRKIDVTFLEGRTTVIKIDKERKIAARDEGVMLLGRLCDYIKANQEAIVTALADDADIFEASPLYVKPVPAVSAEDQQHHCGCDANSEYRNNTPGSALFLTPPLL